MHKKWELAIQSLQDLGFRNKQVQNSAAAHKHIQCLIETLKQISKERSDAKDELEKAAITYDLKLRKLPHYLARNAKEQEEAIEVAMQQRREGVKDLIDHARDCDEQTKKAKEEADRLKDQHTSLLTARNAAHKLWPQVCQLVTGSMTAKQELRIEVNELKCKIRDVQQQITNWQAEIDDIDDVLEEQAVEFREQVDLLRANLSRRATQIVEKKEELDMAKSDADDVSSKVYDARVSTYQIEDLFAKANERVEQMVYNRIQEERKLSVCQTNHKDCVKLVEVTAENLNDLKQRRANEIRRQTDFWVDTMEQVELASCERGNKRSRHALAATAKYDINKKMTDANAKLATARNDFNIVNEKLAAAMGELSELQKWRKRMKTELQCNKNNELKFVVTHQEIIDKITLELKWEKSAKQQLIMEYELSCQHLKEETDQMQAFYLNTTAKIDDVNEEITDNRKTVDRLESEITTLRKDRKPFLSAEIPVTTERFEKMRMTLTTDIKKMKENIETMTVEVKQVELVAINVRPAYEGKKLVFLEEVEETDNEMEGVIAARRLEQAMIDSIAARGPRLEASRKEREQLLQELAELKAEVLEHDRRHQKEMASVGRSLVKLIRIGDIMLCKNGDIYIKIDDVCHDINDFRKSFRAMLENLIHRPKECMRLQNEFLVLIRAATELNHKSDQEQEGSISDMKKIEEFSAGSEKRVKYFMSRLNDTLEGFRLPGSLTESAADLIHTSRRELSARRFSLQEECTNRLHSPRRSESTRRHSTGIQSVPSHIKFVIKEQSSRRRFASVTSNIRATVSKRQRTKAPAGAKQRRQTSFDSNSSGKTTSSGSSSKKSSTDRSANTAVSSLQTVTT